MKHGDLMIKLLMLALVGFIIYSMVSGLFLRIGRPRRPENRSNRGETMVEDPQCGTYLPQSDAIKAHIHGQEHYFCSQKCLKDYKKSQRK